LNESAVATGEIGEVTPEGVAKICQRVVDALGLEPRAGTEEEAAPEEEA
jgi:hypothetical protein